MKSNLIYKGILLTPNLWKNDSIYNIEQFEINNSEFIFSPIDVKLRLGMYVEQVIFQAIENNSESKLIITNLQIIENGVTLGELDCIFKEKNQIVHLEIVYKFYLFDPTINHNQLECWIGPNRKDSLIKKLNKLRDKQFPLLELERTKEMLKQFQLKPNQITQKVCFKAQLFLPLNYSNNIQFLNIDCITGYYYRLSELITLKECKFHIPNKIDWPSIIQVNLEWMSFENFYKQIEVLLNEKRSPLCFVKDKKGNLSKIFIVWW